MSDTQHEAAIKLVARLMHGMDPGDCSYTLPRNWIDEARKIVAAYDAARSGEAEGVLREIAEKRPGRAVEESRRATGWRRFSEELQRLAQAALAEHPEPRQAEGEQGMHSDLLALVTQFTPRELASKLMHAGVYHERQLIAEEPRQDQHVASEKTRFCLECAHTTGKHKGTKRGGTSCDVAGCRCPALPDPEDDPEDHPVTTPSDIERNTYTADRALGLHTARLAEQDQPVDRASGEESEFDFELPTDWETHGMEELDLYARHLDIDVDAIIERTGGLTKPHLVAAIRRQFEPPVEHPETGEREGMLSEADSMKAVIGTVTPRDRDVWQAGRIYEQCLAAEPLQDGGERDLRSAMVLVEAQPTEGAWRWHGMAFVAGENINDIYGSDRTVVLDDCICSVAGAGVDVELAECDPRIDHPHQDVERRLTNYRAFEAPCAELGPGLHNFIAVADIAAALAPSPDDRGGER